MSFFLTSFPLQALCAGVGTAVAAIFTEYLSIKLKQKRKSESAKLDQIISVLKTDDEALKIAVSESVAKSMENGESAQKEVRDSIKRIEVKLAALNSPAREKAFEELISSYHEQALSQAKVQFWFSVFAATFGFGWIIVSGIQIRTDQLSTVFGITPGAVMDAVAFLFFRQASETQRRATELFDRLRNDKKSGEALALVGAIPNPMVKSIVQAQLALHMAGLKQESIDVIKFMELAEKKI
jgi:hypothetical protein